MIKSEMREQKKSNARALRNLKGGFHSTPLSVCAQRSRQPFHHSRTVTQLQLVKLATNMFQCLSVSSAAPIQV
jgi:hypothetical protein